MQQLRSYLKFPHFQNSKEIIAMNISLDSSSTESDVEQSSEEGSPIRKNTPAILNSTEISGAMERGHHNLLCRLSGTTNCDSGL